MTRVENIERKIEYSLPLYYEDIPLYFRLQETIPETPPSFLCIEDICKFMLFLAFPFAVKLVYKHKVWCASKPDTVHNPAAVIV